jgi:hypothetical protein
MITIVTGLPRSGTSMLMQMLKKGGMEILSDHIRQADESNPKGYYEYEKIKSLPQDNSWMAQAEGKAVKIIVQLLKFIPSNFNYKILFIERNIEEVMASQTKMLRRMGKTAGNNEALKPIFLRQAEEVKAWLSESPNIETLYLQYAAIIQNPVDSANQIARFLNSDWDASSAVNSVDANLYRERIVR